VAIITMKRCSTCKLVLELSEFYKDKSRKSGYTNRCKKCERIFCRAKRDRNPLSFKKKDTSYYLRNKEKVISRRKQWYSQNKFKALAHEQVKKALLRGNLLRKPCEECGDEKSIAHHEDYSKPLEVRWLCEKHHMLLHHGKQ
jgi:ribosomal protein S27AE